MKLGQKVTEIVTGFTGVIVGRVEYITGCTQLLIQPRVKEGGEYVTAQWFDEDRCGLATLGIENPKPDETVIVLPRTANGCDMPAPIR